MVPVPGGPGRGRLIVLEGIDGSGKSTVQAALVDALADRAPRVEATREPTGQATGRALREVLQDPEHDPVSEALLFVADHAAHVAWLREVLADGALVLSDRYSYSCRAYQGTTLARAWPEDAGVGPDAWLEATLAPVELVPDLVVLLDVSPETALDRVDGRAREGEKFEDVAFLADVRERYLAMADELGFEIVDASGSLEATQEACHAVVEKHLEGWSP